MIRLDPELDEMDDPTELPEAIVALHNELLEVTASQLRSRAAKIDELFEEEFSGRITAAEGRVHVDYDWSADRGAQGVSALAALLHARTVTDWWQRDASGLLRNMQHGPAERAEAPSTPEGMETGTEQVEPPSWRQAVTVVHASALGAYTLRLSFSDGLGGDVDLSAHLAPGTARVTSSDPVAFTRLRCSEDGLTVEWDSGERWCAADLYYRLLRTVAPIAADQLIRADLNRHASRREGGWSVTRGGPETDRVPSRIATLLAKATNVTGRRSVSGWSPDRNRHRDRRRRTRAGSDPSPQ